MCVRVPENIAAVAIEVFIDLVPSGHKVITIGYTVKTKFLAEPCQVHQLIHLYKGE